MAFTLVWLEGAADTFREIEAAARKSLETRTKPYRQRRPGGRGCSSKLPPFAVRSSAISARKRSAMLVLLPSWSKNTRMINMVRAHYCWDSPQVDALFIFK